MTTHETIHRFRLRITAEADPGVLARVLERFQNRNIVPRTVRAEWGIPDMLHIDVEVSGVSEQTMTLIASKLNQVPMVLNAYWYRA